MVQSSKMLQVQQERQIKHNRMKYQFIAKLMINSSEMQPMLKTFNSWKLFGSTRKRIKAAALDLLNRRKKGDLYLSFKLWK